MKKKIVMCLIVSCMAVVMWGCGALRLPVPTANTGTEAEVDGNAEEKEDTNEKEEEEQEESASGTPVLGQEDIDGYEGFTYLYDEILRTDSEANKETGKMEKKQITVYIPQADYTSVNRSNAYSTALGVTLEVELEPYIQYDMKDYLVTENLECYLEEYYDPFYTANYKDMVKSEVEEIGENAARATVEYCEYDSWDDKYITFFVTYYLVELEDKMVLVTTTVNESGVTGKTPKLLEELEAFYQFEIDWDAKRAEQKRNDYLASGGDNTYSTGYLLFQLPENWALDNENSSYDSSLYAPEGDSGDAGCGIVLMNKYLGSDEIQSVNDFIANKDIAEEYVKELAGDYVDDIDISSCDTCLGKAAKFVYDISAGNDKAKCEMYYIPSEYDLYIIYVFQTGDGIEDPFPVAADILENGQVR
jgi:hypothetical protein